MHYYDTNIILSILYKTKLPFMVVFNKIDVVSHEPFLKWMSDFEAFQEALEEEEKEDEGTYMNSLVRSMGLVLDEFYRQLRVSSGFTTFIVKILTARVIEFVSDGRCLCYNWRRYGRAA
jgi:GTPase SAR1 family protein